VFLLEKEVEDVEDRNLPAYRKLTDKTKYESAQEIPGCEVFGNAFSAGEPA